MPDIAQAIAAPTSPARRVGTLLASVPLVENSREWEQGFAYKPIGCGAVTGSVDPCAGTEKAIPETPDPAAVRWEPFGIWAGDRCSTFGFSEHDYQAYARAVLTNCQSKLVEAELWRGTLTRAADPDWPNAYLTNNALSDVLSNSPMDAGDALGCLEQALAQCGCTRGVIHATPQTVTAWAAQSLVRREGGLILTTLDTIVVAGSGYDGSGPSLSAGGAPQAAANGSIWAYATDMLTVRLSSPISVFPATLAEATTRATNFVEVRAERLAAYSYDGCCQAAVAIDLPLCGIGGAGS